jgi:hypothetical protein
MPYGWAAAGHHVVVAPPYSTAEAPHRTYSSLQDIESDEDDDSEEDRF